MNRRFLPGLCDGFIIGCTYFLYLRYDGSVSETSRYETGWLCGFPIGLITTVAVVARLIVSTVWSLL